MRLTLRTLLAWLDDTLTPSEVREIGQQVSESPFARDLVAKIQKVTRQRRLTIPRGDEAVDPNIVAAYLDNELSGEEVTNFEKTCLTSDVHLAEVASIHQVLSLIGQKAKVPQGARERMYRRVKGRENRSATVQAPIAKPAPRTPVTPPIAAWTTAASARRPLSERFGPLAAVLGLLGILVWSAWVSVRPSEDGANITRVAVNQPEPLNKLAVNAIEGKPLPPKLDEPKVEEPSTELKIAAADTKETTPTVAPGSFGVVGKSDATVLKFVAASKDWERTSTDSKLNVGDRLINLTPGRTELGLSKSVVLLVGQGEILLKAPNAGEAAHLVIEQGRMVVKTPAKAEPLAIEVGSQTFTLSSEGPITVGIGRELARSFPATPLSSAVMTLVAVPVSEVTLTLGSKTEVIHGPKVVALSSDSDSIALTEYPIPAWVTDATLPIVEEGVAKAFQQYFANKRPVLTSLAEATEDEQPEVRRLSIRALGLLGDLSLVIPILGQAGSQASRLAAIEVLRDYRARGQEEALALDDQLRKSYGEAVGRIVQKLLIGYNPVEAQDDLNQARLVALLSDSDVGVRELALENLKLITQRDSMEYDPEKPEGKGLRAWQEALKSKTLSPPKDPKP